MLYQLPNKYEYDLSQRELDVLVLYLQGKYHLEIASRLSIQSKTLYHYLSMVKQKWGYKTQIGLILEAIRRGYSDFYFDAYRDILDNHNRFSKLSPEEIEIIQYLFFDFTCREIAKISGCSPKTMEEKKSNIRRKLGVKNNFELVAVVLKYRKEVLLPLSVELEGVV